MLLIGGKIVKGAKATAKSDKMKAVAAWLQNSAVFQPTLIEPESGLVKQEAAACAIEVKADHSDALEVEIVRPDDESVLSMESSNVRASESLPDITSPSDDQFSPPSEISTSPNDVTHMVEDDGFLSGFSSKLCSMRLTMSSSFEEC